MKTRMLMFASLIVPSLLMGSREKFKIILEPTWENLEQDEQRILRFGGKWILAGSITFKIRSSAKITLSRLGLRWNGPDVPKITGSLYEKNFEKKFYPIEDFLVCDGTWNKKQQTLLFHFDHHCPLQVVNTFYLILTVPPEQEHILKQGSFYIANDYLPNQFQEYLNTTHLSLSFKTPGTKLIVASH